MDRLVADGPGVRDRQPVASDGHTGDLRHSSRVRAPRNPFPTIVLTLLGVGAGLTVALLVGLLSPQPVRLFRRIAIVALLLSLPPDLWMLTQAV